MKINELHKLFPNFQELDPREISRNIMKINDLQKAYPAICLVAADVSRRILDDHAGLVGRP
jgi:hypothetical protein